MKIELIDAGSFTLPPVDERRERALDLLFYARLFDMTDPHRALMLTNLAGQLLAEIEHDDETRRSARH